MRITTVNTHDASIANLQRRQQQLAVAQEQLTSGKRVLRASDDPAAAAAAERALAAASRHDTTLRALQASRSATELTEAALGDAVELMQQAREALVAAGNGSHGDAARGDLAARIRGLRDELLMVANRGDGAGRRLFGGQGSSGAPLVDQPGGVVYTGTPGEAGADRGSTLPLALDGRAVWMQADDPGTPGAALSLFDALDRVVGELSTPGRSTVDTTETVRRGLGEFDSAIANLSGWRTRAGATLNRLEGLGDRLAQDKLGAQTQRSEAEDLDMLAAISDFQNRQSGYDAALKTYSIVQRMSLFEYLR